MIRQLLQNLLINVYIFCFIKPLKFIQEYLEFINPLFESDYLFENLYKEYIAFYSFII